MKKNKVLIVEDEGIISIDMANSLESLGYEVVDALPTGEEALKVLDTVKPDLVLMDIQLAGELDGIQTAEKINSRYDIPIIYISGHTDELTLSRAKITGPYGYITKSFNYNELHTTIDMAIYKNRMQKKVVENEYLLNTTLENIEDAVINIDNEGYIQYLNTAASELLNISKIQAYQLKIDRIGIKWVQADGKDLQHPFQKKRKNKKAKSEYSLINTASGLVTSVECSINILLDSSRNIKGYVYLIQNIEERKKIAAIKSRLASIVESSQDAIIGIDINGVINSWNRGAEDILGYSVDEVLGQNISMLTPPNIPNELPEKIDLLKSGKTVEHYESARLRKSGELIEMSILPSPILNAKGIMTGISFIARNITEKKNLEKEVIEIGEKERERIGRDLHDSLGQELTGILLNIKTIENITKNKLADEELSQIKYTQEMIKSAIEKTRTMAKNMIPVKLQTEGLPHALEDLANFARTVYKKNVITRIDDRISSMNIITETQLYHIAQEAVNNSIKHSGTDMISISLNVLQSEMVLSVKDNGCGFRQEKGEGIGINIMKYRANLVSGTLSVHSEENEGTLILCRVPLPSLEKSK